MNKPWLCALCLLLPLAGCGNDSASTPDTATGPDLVAADATADTNTDATPDTTSDTRADTSADTSPDTNTDVAPPPEFPFDLPREDVGEPLTEEEVTAFTKKITGFYRDTAFFDWVWWTSHGLDASYDPAMPDYKLYWQDTQAYKEGDTIRFVHTGGADNLMIRTSKIMAAVANAYLATGDMKFGRIVRQYAKGYAALSQGYEWESEQPVVKYLQSRAIFTHDHSYEMEGGRKVTVEYGPVKEKEKYDWNAHTIPNDQNPAFGAIWIRTMRSKDDVPHIYRSVPMLRRVAQEGAHEDVRAAADLALEYMEGFARDIVDNGYQIRTKDKEGNAHVPLKEDGTVNDLASFVLFEDLIPNAECGGKLSSALIAYHEPLDNDCGENDHNLYEDIATQTHYFNLAIIRFFHLACVTNALAAGEYDAAKTLLVGLMKRSDRYLADSEEPADHHEWYPDLAGWLLAAAASGMPLTSQEARLVMQEYAASADHYAAWDRWDPWNPDLPDGAFNYKPDRKGYVEPGNPESDPRTYIRLPEMSFVLEYCSSPWLPTNGARLLDCDIVNDPSRWGED